MYSPVALDMQDFRGVRSQNIFHVRGGVGADVSAKPTPASSRRFSLHLTTYFLAFPEVLGCSALSLFNFLSTSLY